jgi:pimeloyl-ACP methyl ester carboxylesterase
MSDLFMSDGTRISYRVEGSGPALVLSNGLTTSTVFWKHLIPAWSSRHTVVSWDLPGHGDSGPALSKEAASIEAQARCVLRLMDELGIERATQIGWSTGCQIVCEVLRTEPQRCCALVLLLGPAGHVLTTARLPVPSFVIEAIARYTPPRAFALGFRTLSQLARTPAGDPVGRMLRLIGPRTSRDDARGVLLHIPTVEPVTLQHMLLSAADHDASAALAQAKVPVSIIAGDADPFAPSELVGLPLSQLAWGSELLRLPEGTHTALLDDAPQIARHVERFVARVTSNESSLTQAHELHVLERGAVRCQPLE